MGTEDDRTRSGLAFAFLDLVEQHRPPAILLENVPGLLSSNGGKDLGALLGRLGELGYWWAYRILDAQFFGVPQRRRRVFICAFHAGAGFGADSAAAVLSVGARCGGHSQASDEAGAGASGVLADGARSTRTVQSAFGHHGWTLGAQDVDGGYLQLSPSPDSGGVRETDGMAGRLDDREVIPFAQNQRGEVRDLGETMSQLTTGGGKPGEGYPAVFTKRARVSGPDAPETWEEGGPMTTLNSFDVGDIRTTAAVLGSAPSDDALLPLGLDSHRYRCCGNGVVSNVSEWIGVRLARAILEAAERAA
jgi:DNA (cytosine-5)-methyltransferase 1